MTTDGRTYLLARVLDDTCRCDDRSASSVPSVTGSLSQLPEPALFIERSSSVMSEPALHVDRLSTASSDGVHQPVRRTQTVSGRVLQPPRPLRPIQRTPGFNPASK